MGGGAMPEQGGGGKKRKKSLDAIINVVPAIDLLSCCITFLLYTAVWTQISRLQVQQFGAGAPDDTSISDQEKAVLVRVELGERGIAVRVNEDAAQEIPLVQKSTTAEEQAHGAAAVEMRQDFSGLHDRLKVVKETHPDARSVLVITEDTVPYGDLIQAIDTCKGQGLDAVSVTGA
jgi:biopolymer transport protein TolR